MQVCILIERLLIFLESSFLERDEKNKQASVERDPLVKKLK